MKDGDISVVGLSTTKKSGKTNWKIIAAFIGIIVLALGIIAGILLVRQQQNIREKAQIVSCTDPTVEQCPVAGNPNILRNCHPPQSDNSPTESICNEEGKSAFCGTKNYCCPSQGGNWTTDMGVCFADTNTKTDLLPEADITCSQGFVDEFNSIDSTKWTSMGNVSIQSGVLVVQRQNLGSQNPNEMDGLISKQSITGDFVVEVDIPDISKTAGPGGGGAYIVLETGNATTDRLQVFRVISNTGEYQFNVMLNVGASSYPYNANLPKGPMTVKIERKGGKFSIYRKTTGAYTSVFSPDVALNKTINSIQLRTRVTGSPGATITAKYDNFKISCASVPTPTVTPTATSSTRTATPTSTSTTLLQCNSICTSNTQCPSELRCLATSDSSSKRCRRQACSGESDCICNVTATPTVTATATTGSGTKTATPTVTATATTGSGTKTATPTPTENAGTGGTTLRTQTPTPTSASTSAPIPVTGSSNLTVIGAGFGVIMLLISLALAF